MSLLDVKQGSWSKVLRVEGGAALAAALRQYGVFPGDRIRVLRSAPLGGPLLVEVNAREVALGRGVAACVVVEAEACASL